MRWYFGGFTCSAEQKPKARGKSHVIDRTIECDMYSRKDIGADEEIEVPKIASPAGGSGSSDSWWFGERELKNIKNYPLRYFRLRYR